MPYRLPPLHTLRLFEAAGRHLSFKLAAEEIGVTPSAVSHAIQSLEDWLGVALFARGHRSLALTAAGDAYLPPVREALDRLTAATDELPGRRASGPLSISVAPSFAVNWLVEKLPHFRTAHPNIDITLDTTRQKIDFPRAGTDLAIRMGMGDWPNLHAVCLVMEDLIPVCAPALAPAIATPADLAGQTLLHVTSVAQDWQCWSELSGVKTNSARGLRFDTIQLALQAAINGLGVAIGRLPLIDGHLAAGRLVGVLGPARRSQTGYWLVMLPEAVNRPDVVAFRDWITAELPNAGGAARQQPA